MLSFCCSPCYRHSDTSQAAGNGPNPIAQRLRIGVMDARGTRPASAGPGLPEGRDRDLDGLLSKVARGDEAAFASLYDQLAGPVYGLIRRVVRDPAQSEEVAQEGPA